MSNSDLPIRDVQMEKENSFEKKTMNYFVLTVIFLAYSIGATGYILFLIVYSSLGFSELAFICHESQKTNVDLIKTCQLNNKNEISTLKQHLAECTKQKDVLERIKSHCEDEWKYYSLTNSCYRLYHQEDVQQPASKQICHDHQSHLVSIGSKEENTFIYNFALQEPAIIKIWIGLEYTPTLGRRVWSDGSPNNYSIWGGTAMTSDRVATVMCIRCGPRTEAAWYTDPVMINPSMRWNGFMCKKKPLF